MKRPSQIPKWVVPMIFGCPGGGGGWRWSSCLPAPPTPKKNKNKNKNKLQSAQMRQCYNQDTKVLICMKSRKVFNSRVQWNIYDCKIKRFETSHSMEKKKTKRKNWGKKTYDPPLSYLGFFGFRLISDLRISGWSEFPHFRPWAILVSLVSDWFQIYRFPDDPNFRISGFPYLRVYAFPVWRANLH